MMLVRKVWKKNYKKSKLVQIETILGWGVKETKTEQAKNKGRIVVFTW